VLCDCGLQDSAVNTIAASLKRLRKLKLDCNPGEVKISFCFVVDVNICPT
jgi:hypothetical protein